MGNGLLYFDSLRERKRKPKRKTDYFFFLLETLIRPFVSHPDLK